MYGGWSNTFHRMDRGLFWTMWATWWREFSCNTMTSLVSIQGLFLLVEGSTIALFVDYEVTAFSGSLASKRTVSITIPADSWDLNFFRVERERDTSIACLQLFPRFESGDTMSHRSSQSVEGNASPSARWRCKFSGYTAIVCCL